MQAVTEDAYQYTLLPDYAVVLLQLCSSHCLKRHDQPAVQQYMYSLQWEKRGKKTSS
jgi:hypothetical protein